MKTKKKYAQPLCNVELAETCEIMIVASNINVTDEPGTFDVKEFGFPTDPLNQNSWDNIWDEE